MGGKIIKIVENKREYFYDFAILKYFLKSFEIRGEK